MKWVIPLLLVVLLGGCGPSVNVEVLQSETMKAINQDQVKGGRTVMVKAVSLVLENGNKYTGFADLTDGTRHSLTVTYDGSKLIYNIL